MTAAQAVRDAMNGLLIKVRDGGWDVQQAGQYDAACDNILGATDRLFNSMGNAGEMVKQAKILAQVGELHCIYEHWTFYVWYIKEALVLLYLLVLKTKYSDCV